jgi:hypothetical protein
MDLRAPIHNTQNDDPEFVELVKRLIAGCTHDSFPNTIIVIRIDNWFDYKWLGFSGRGRVGFASLGNLGADTALDEFRQDQITLPPFSPRRVIEEFHFQRQANGEYSARDPHPSLHAKKLGSSSQNLHKRITDRVDSAVLVWFSSNTRQNLRGSVMVYEVNRREVNIWYAAFEKAGKWRVVETKGIPPIQVQSVIENAPNARS